MSKTYVTTETIEQERSSNDESGKLATPDSNNTPDIANQNTTARDIINEGPTQIAVASTSREPARVESSVASTSRDPEPQPGTSYQLGRFSGRVRTGSHPLFGKLATPDSNNIPDTANLNTRARKIINEGPTQIAVASTSREPARVKSSVASTSRDPEPQPGTSFGLGKASGRLCSGSDPLFGKLATPDSNNIPDIANLNTIAREIINEGPTQIAVASTSREPARVKSSVASTSRDPEPQPGTSFQLGRFSGRVCTCSDPLFALPLTIDMDLIQTINTRISSMLLGCARKSLGEETPTACRDPGPVKVCSDLEISNIVNEEESEPFGENGVLESEDTDSEWCYEYGTPPPTNAPGDSI